MTGVSLKVDIAGIQMQNPVTTASGTFGWGLEYSEYLDVNLLGAVVLKSITCKRKIGNPPPRIIETPSGVLNSIGLANPGIDVFLRETLPQLKAIKVPVIASIAGDTVEEYVYLAEKLSAEEQVAGIEVNISCPNVREGGLEFAVSALQVEKLVSSVARVAGQPLIVKLSPNVTSISDIARAAVQGGAHALSLINTLVGMVIDTQTRRPALLNKVGGLAGPAVRPVAVRMVWQAAQAVDVPIIGMGGICTAEDALQFIMAGASGVAVGTYSFVNPGAALDIIRGLEEFCLREGVRDINELVGCSL